jgi:predicted MFS family arabinose efflux permease
MGRVSAAVEVVMGTPQALSIALGALLVTVFGFHVIFAIMATVTMLAVAYLLVSLRSHLSQTLAVPDAEIRAEASPDVAPPATVSAASIVVTDLPTSGMA